MDKGPRKLYTRFGDQGLTRLLGGETVQKDDPRIDTCGALDELQSALGVARSLLCDESTRSVLLAVQQELFVAGAELASTPWKASRLERRITGRDVERLEAWIDRMSGEYGLPTGFVAPGESPASAALHLARSICRRVERSTVRLNRGVGGYKVLIVYFNRLSDLLFALAWSATVMAAVEKVLGELAAAPTRQPGKGKI